MFIITFAKKIYPTPWRVRQTVQTFGDIFTFKTAEGGKEIKNLTNVFF